MGQEGWPGRRSGEGSEAARCSCAEDREDGRGRLCALQRQVPAVLRVRSGRASASVRFQRVGLSSCDAESGAHSANSTVRCRLWGRCHARRRATTGAGERSVQAALVAFSGGGTAAGRGAGGGCLLSAGCRGSSHR